MAERAGEADVVVIDDGETKSSCGSEKWVEQLVRQLDARQRGESASGAPGPKRRRKDHRSKDKPGNGTGFGGEHAAKEAKRDSQLRAEKELVERENDESIGRILSSLGEALQVSGEPNRIMADMRGSPGLSLTLQRLLRNECLLDVGRRAMAYTPLLSFLSSLARRQEFWPLLLAPLHKEGWGKDRHAEQDTARHPNLKNPPTAGSIPDDDEQSEGEGETVCGLLRGLQVQAKLFVSMCESSANVRSGEGEGEEEYMAAMAVCLHVNDVVDSMNAAADAAGGAGGRASGVCNTAGGKERVGEKRRRWQGRARDSEQAGKQKEEDGGVGMAGAGQAESDAEAYVRVMSPRKFAAIALLPMLHDAVVGFAFPLEGPVPAQGGHAGWMGGFRHSGVGGHLGGARVVTAKGRTVRIASEVASLAASLPVQFASSIFVRVDETRPDVIKALISGPEDTPYAHGLFEFDIRLPDDYPQRPPLVKLLTTGNGTVRFNPNLYQDGKVCLSLLGTWSGPGWHPETSTLLQVLVSVQALIMVPDPCFNEPGHEALRNKPGGNSMSASYNLGVWENNVRYALLGAGKRPSPVFKEVIERHLVLKRRAILQDCEKWEAEANRPVLHAPWLAGVRQGRDGIWAVTKELRAFLQGLDPNLLEESEDDQEVNSEVNSEVRAGRGEDGEEPLVPRHAVDAVVVDDDEDGSVGAEAAATSRMAQSRGVVSVPDECIVLD